METACIEMDIDGKTYRLYKIPAVDAREIVAQYPMSAVPKIGDYKINETMMFKILSYVEVILENGQSLRLKTKELINNHVPSWETLAKIEKEMITYNCSFFQDGRASTFLSGIAQNIPAKITKILTDLSQQLLQTNKPLSTN